MYDLVCQGASHTWFVRNGRACVLISHPFPQRAEFVYNVKPITVSQIVAYRDIALMLPPPHKDNDFVFLAYVFTNAPHKSILEVKKIHLNDGELPQQVSQLTFNNATTFFLRTNKNIYFYRVPLLAEENSSTFAGSLKKRFSAIFFPMLPDSAISNVNMSECSTMMASKTRGSRSGGMMLEKCIILLKSGKNIFMFSYDYHPELAFSVSVNSSFRFIGSSILVTSLTQIYFGLLCLQEEDGRARNWMAKVIPFERAMYSFIFMEEGCEEMINFSLNLTLLESTHIERFVFCHTYCLLLTRSGDGGLKIFVLSVNPCERSVMLQEVSLDPFAIALPNLVSKTRLRLPSMKVSAICYDDESRMAWIWFVDTVSQVQMLFSLNFAVDRTIDIHYKPLPEQCLSTLFGLEAAHSISRPERSSSGILHWPYCAPLEYQGAPGDSAFANPELPPNGKGKDRRR